MKKKKLTYQKRKALVGLSFISPWILGVAVLFIFPMIYSLIISFSEIISMSDFKLKLIGIDNYKEVLFGDVHFPSYFISSLEDAIINPILILSFSLFIAVLINRKIKGKTIFRTILFLPVVLGTGFIMEQLLGENVQQQSAEIVNRILLSGELASSLPYTVVNMIEGLLQRITVILWSSGVQIVLFLGGLQSINASIYEAADVDAAAAWEKFWLITFPLILPTLLLNTVYTIVDSFASSSNETLSYIIETAFVNNKFEASSAMGWMYFGFIFIIIGIVYLLLNRKVEGTI